MRAVLVAAAGALGALARYAVGLALGPRGFPWGTLAVNVSGAAVLGFVLTWGPERWAPTTTAAVAVGFLGAYTTFSTFAWEAFALGRTGRTAPALAYLAVSVGAGVAAAAAGHGAARAALR